MFSVDVIKAVWNLTRCGDLLDQRYKAALWRVCNMQPLDRYQQPFEVAKPSGGYRRIRPAKPNLALVQSVLADWMLRHLPLGNDYCYIGHRGVLTAVKKHLGSKSGAVYDLERAFEYVYAPTILSWLHYYQPQADLHVLECIADLLTFEGVAPQGCVSTPYAFNLLIRPFDQAIQLYCKTRSLVVTRYSDNICISSSGEFDFEEVDNHMSLTVDGCGFQLNHKKTKNFSTPPIEYLGTRIYPDKLSLDARKIEEILERFEEILYSSTPEFYRKMVNGLWVWTKHICGDDIPKELYQVFSDYYTVVGKPPRSFVRWLTPKLFK